MNFVVHFKNSFLAQVKDLSVCGVGLVFEDITHIFYLISLLAMFGISQQVSLKSIFFMLYFYLLGISSFY